MMSTMNRPMHFLGALTLILAIGALPVFANGQQQSSTRPHQIILRIAWWGSQARNTRTLQVIKMFEKRHAGVKVEPTALGWNGYWQKMSTEAAGGGLPDVMQQSIAYVKPYAKKNLIVDLNPYVSNGTLNLSNVAKSEDANGTVNGKLYGVSLGAAADGIMYNPAMFRKAGVPMPRWGWTWSDLIYAMNTIHKKLGVWGSGGIPMGSYSLLEYYLQQHGENILNPSQTAVDYTNTYFVKFLKMWKSLENSGALPSARVLVADSNQGIQDSPIVHGKAAMAWADSNQLVALEASANRPLSIAPYPSGGTTTPRLLRAAMLFSVGQASKQKKLAVEFINYFTNSLQANRVLLAERGVPISSKVRGALKSYMKPAQVKEFDYVSLLVKHSVPAVAIAASSAATRVQSTVLQKIEYQFLYGEITATQAANKFRREATSVLQQG